VVSVYEYLLGSVVRSELLILFRGPLADWQACQPMSVDPVPGLMSNDLCVVKRHCGKPKQLSLDMLHGSRYRFGVLLEMMTSSRIVPPS